MIPSLNSEITQVSLDEKVLNASNPFFNRKLKDSLRVFSFAVLFSKTLARFLAAHTSNKCSNWILTFMSLKHSLSGEWI